MIRSEQKQVLTCRRQNVKQIRINNHNQYIVILAKADIARRILLAYMLICAVLILSFNVLFFPNIVSIKASLYCG